MLLVTGANGQLGSEIRKLLPNAIYTTTGMLDITDSSHVAKFIAQYKIDTIVNCAAYTAVDKAEDDIDTATKVNVDGPKNLAHSGAKIIHISTDYVFDGTGHRPYTTDDKTNPMSVYGKTKLAGEKAVLDNADVAIVIRTAWLYSTHGNNFVKTMRRLGAQKKSFGVVADQIGTPTFAGDLAMAIVKILPQINQTNRGIYHFTNEGVCSWYDFAQEIMSLSGLNCAVNPIRTADYQTRATRPLYSVLDKTKIKQTFDIQIRHWKPALQHCISQFDR